MEIESVDQYPTVQKNPAMDVVRNLIDLHRSERSMSRRRSMVGVKAEKIQQLRELRGKNFGKEVSGEQL